MKLEDVVSGRSCTEQSETVAQIHIPDIHPSRNLAGCSDTTSTRTIQSAVRKLLTVVEWVDQATHQIQDGREVIRPRINATPESCEQVKHERIWRISWNSGAYSYATRTPFRSRQMLDGYGGRQAGRVGSERLIVGSPTDFPGQSLNLRGTML